MNTSLIIKKMIQKGIIMQKERNMSLDLLKICSIIGVIILHYNNTKFGGLLSNPLTSNKNILIGNIMEAITIISPNLFILISGYFLCKDNKIKIRKIVEIVMICIFYGISIFAIAVSFGLIKLDLSSIKILLKTICGHWFIDIYIILYILHPFINKLINNLNKKQNLYLIYIVFFFFSILPSFFTDITVKDGGYGIINFILLYLIAAYIRNYHDDYKINNRFLFTLFMITLSMGILGKDYGKIYNYNFAGVIFNSLIVFLIFKKYSFRKSKIITTISSCSLATMLIHGHYNIETWMYQVLFNSKAYWNSKYMIIHMIVSCIIIFIICITIEVVRKKIFKHSIDLLLERIKIANRIYSID